MLDPMNDENDILNNVEMMTDENGKPLSRMIQRTTINFLCCQVNRDIL